MTTATTSRTDTSLAELVDHLTKLIADERHVHIEAFIADHASHAEELRKLLPMVRSLVAIGEQAATSDAGLALCDNSDDSKILGDFRILRQIGRGGMGIVYEAEQISLRRRVALKILPFAAVLDPRHLQRFKNEALAAASLDHPNIVEVHAVGCERGVHFYAMRYVEGQTLAAVIDGMRNDECGMRNEASSDAENVAHSELNTPYAVPADTPNSAFPTPNSGLPHSPFPIPHSPFADTSAIAVLSTLRTERPRDYYRTIANLGIQAAEALDHAHQMGIVHRDIKPTNLMLECSPRDRSHLAPRDETNRTPSRSGAAMPHHAESL